MAECGVAFYRGLLRINRRKNTREPSPLRSLAVLYSVRLSTLGWTCPATASTTWTVPRREAWHYSIVSLQLSQQLAQHSTPLHPTAQHITTTTPPQHYPISFHVISYHIICHIHDVCPSHHHNLTSSDPTYVRAYVSRPQASQASQRLPKTPKPPSRHDETQN